MEPLPVKPTQVPQARRYTRHFLPNATKIFQKGDLITIDIPPIKNTYLTKDARLHFQMDMSFRENSKTSIDALISTIAASPGMTESIMKQFVADFFQDNLGMAGITPLQPKDYLINTTRKPVPVLDVCGPYGLFRKVGVYDYLGNTLLENVERHDLLAAQMADFYLDHEVDRLRPMVSDDFQDAIQYTKGTYGVPPRSTRVNGIPLWDPDGGNFYLSRYTLAAPEQTLSHVTGTTYTSSGEVADHNLNTWDFSIDLLSFLGRGSTKFVPLHNGFRLTFEINDPNVPIKFGLPQGTLLVPVSISGLPAPFYWELEPSITKFSVSSPYLRCELLEITPELDAQVEKVILATMRSYVLKGRTDTPTIIPGNFLSAKTVCVSFRHLPQNVDTYSVLGYRSRTGVSKARLLYNDATHQEFNSVEEARVALGETFSHLISREAFSANSPDQLDDTTGTGGYMYPYPTLASRLRLYEPDTASGGDQAGYAWFNDATSGVHQNVMFKRYNNQEGKFLVKFDLDLIGYGKDQIRGVDFTKTTVKLDLTRENPVWEAYETDIFTEFDAVVSIGPDKYCTVSF